MSAPLAERLRPKTIDDYIGQEHLVGKNGVFRKFFETGNVPSFILWGPPGVGKTTLAKIVATQLERPFFTLSAVTSGVKDVREVIESARKQRFFDQKAPLLFIDEIHRFNKSQQDSLLGAVEQGVFTLIGATTENPSFEVISPLLSRCQVYILKSLEDKDLQVLLDRALTTDTELKERDIEVTETGALFRFSGGDARKLLNILEIVVGATDGKVTITDRYVTDFPNGKTANMPGCIAIPHLGASTPESEENCAVMAVRQLQDYLVNGNIKNSVNLPNVSQEWSGIARLCLIHRNIPAMLSKIMTTLSDDGINVENMTNKSKKDYAYTLVDVNTRITDDVADELRAIEGVIRVRVLNH